MSNIRELFEASLIKNVINLSWCIILSKLVEAVVEELFVVFMNIEGFVCARELTTSVVAKPHIVALISEHDCE